MNIEEAIQDIKDIKTIVGGKSLEIAIDVLEKQVAISRNVKSGKYYCPKCNTEIKLSGFCNKCGQKLY